ncbi:hypothetical protein [Mesorhizobium comanense]|uniref:hypothetical protein n=1 Tax=Mesorhizobium comanense TaxID=2502215 RepID=UPI001AED9335|nr:hypothetical protein [Mesorhizobium comanense]
MPASLDLTCVVSCSAVHKEGEGLRNQEAVTAMPALALATGVALAVSTAAACAGDAAARRIVGVLPDGAYFAFEQYGELDAGASVPGYSQSDIIDTRADEFVGGKPILIVQPAVIVILAQRFSQGFEASTVASSP